MGSPGGGAMIAVTRSSGARRDIFRSYQVLIDNQTVAKIRRGQRVELPVAAGRHEIYLRIDWARSPSIQVDISAGETIELNCEPGGGASEGLAAVVGEAAQSYIRLSRA